MKKVFEPITTAHLSLKNHIAMAPLTRSRAVGNLPNDLMATYYQQRAGAGLIIAEGTSPSPNGYGYPNVPGIYQKEQIAGWKKTTDAVHQANSKIFLQLMHTGRISHPDNLPEGAKIIAPSAIQAKGEIITIDGMRNHPTPTEMSLEDIASTQEEYVQAAKNAIEAGFDGVEIHAANGYLPNQFINKGSNHRLDVYGGSLDNRLRFVLEIVEKTVAAIGAGKVGIRISPYGVFNDMAIYDDINATYQTLVNKLNELDLAYLHIIDVNAVGAKAPENYSMDLVKHYNGAVIFNGGLALEREKAEWIVDSKDNYFISIGAPFIANPDLVSRLENGEQLSAPNQATIYTPGPEGYTDYPSL